MKIRTSPSLTSFSRQLFAIMALSGTAAWTVHCSTSPAAMTTSKDDGGTSEEAPPDTGASGDLLKDAGAVVGNDGGTIDSGRDAGEVISVCGGSKGDPSAVPLLDWQIRTFPSKYAVELGVKSDTTEPFFWSAKGAIVTGSQGQEIGKTTKGFAGQGPFHEVANLIRSDFSANTMGETDVAFAFEKTLGWSGTLNAVYDVRTSLFDKSLTAYRVTGRAGYFTDGPWTLSRPVRTPSASSSDFYVQTIEPSHGMGWFVTVLFDHECKGKQFDALVGGFPLAMFAPPAPHTRAEVSKFLVDNNARILLTVVTFGAENAAVKAALTGTQASAATLDDFHATMTALMSALDGYMAFPGPSDYASLTAGTNPNWVIGRVTAYPVPSQ